MSECDIIMGVLEGLGDLGTGLGGDLLKPFCGLVFLDPFGMIPCPPLEEAFGVLVDGPP